MTKEPDDWLTVAGWTVLFMLAIFAAAYLVSGR